MISESSQSTRAVENTHTIARNSFWYGLEMLSSIGAAFVTSILVARFIGPYRLGPYQTVSLLTNVTTGIGGTGISITALKYMAEYLNRGEAGVARSIYRYALWYQVCISIALTLGGVMMVLWFGDPRQRMPYLLLIASIAPRMIGFISSSANNAAEAMKRNTGPALIGGFVNTFVTLLGLRAGWDLNGIAAGFSVGCLVETGLKLRAVSQWMGPVTPVPLPSELKRRMLSFSGKGIVLMILNIVVWDRSDLLILRWMNPDIRQVTFFAITFGLTDKLLMLPNAFAGSLTTTMMAQFGRGKDRIGQITVTGARYGLLVALPLLCGMACLSRPFVLAAYGKKDYQGMIPVMAIATMMAIPKALSAAPNALLQTVDKQRYLIWVGCICGAVDVALDFLLTPTYGAAGAAWANGVAQTAAVIALWTLVQRDFHLDLRLKEFGRIALSAVAMAAVVLPTQYLLPVAGFLRVILSALAGAIVWCTALRVTGALEQSDVQRLTQIVNRVSQPQLRAVGSALIRRLT